MGTIIIQRVFLRGIYVIPLGVLRGAKIEANNVIRNVPRPTYTVYTVATNFGLSSITIAIYLTGISGKKVMYFYAFFACTLSQDSDAGYFA